jgi:molybdopterin-guanine dinucleotide biosynthesis protein A
MTVGAVVLAGGQARRMGGGDKTLLTVVGRPMLEAIIAALDADEVAISANGDPARFARFGLPVLGDGAFLGQGPLAGVLAGLTWAAQLGMIALLTVPGDTPFLPSGLASNLAPHPAYAVSGGQPHYLVALWPVSCAPELRRFLSVPGKRDVRLFGESIGMRPVDFPMRGRDQFANVNTPDDLARARQGVSYETSPDPRRSGGEDG